MDEASAPRQRTLGHPLTLAMRNCCGVRDERRQLKETGLSCVGVSTSVPPAHASVPHFKMAGLYAAEWSKPLSGVRSRPPPPLAPRCPGPLSLARVVGRRRGLAPFLSAPVGAHRVLSAQASELDTSPNSSKRTPRRPASADSAGNPVSRQFDGRVAAKGDKEKNHKSTTLGSCRRTPRPETGS